MKTFHLNDLKTIGINPLTGEADAYCMRLLCDLSESGCLLVARYHGLRYDSSKLGSDASPFTDNWNSMVGDVPAVASVMLTRETLWSIARFALYEQGYEYVIATDDTYYALKEWEEYTRPYLELASGNPAYKVFRNPAQTNTAQPRAGDRNQHAMTGRTE